MFGLGFLDDLVSQVGLPLVKKGIKQLTGIDLDDGKLSKEDKQKLLDNQLEIMKLDFEKLKLESEERVETKKMFIDDKANARTREVEITKSTGKKDNTVIILAGVIVLGFFAGLISLIYIQLDKGSGTYELLYIMFGALVAKFGTVIDYFFGASDTK